LGSPIHLTADFGYPVTARENASLFASEGGGVLFDRSVYLISLALKLFGPVKDVQASALIDADGIDVHSSVTLVHDRSATSQLAASFVALMPNVATISCSRGMIRIEEPLVGSEGLRIMAAPNSGAVAGSADASFRSALKRGLKTSALLRRVKRRLGTGISETHSYGSNQYVPFLEHVFDLVRSGKSQSQAIPLDLSLEVLHIVDRARRCHIGNGWNP
jgi:predicted dehydrogenase